MYRTKKYPQQILAGIARDAVDLKVLESASAQEVKMYDFLVQRSIAFDYQKAYTVFEEGTIYKDDTIPLLSTGGIPQTKVIVDFVFRFGDYTILLDTKGWVKQKKNGKTKYNREASYFNLKYNLLRRKLYHEGRRNHIVVYVASAQRKQFQMAVIEHRNDPEAFLLAIKNLMA